MAPLAPYLLSDFTGADEDPLSESGRWMGWWPTDDELQRLSGTASAHNPGTGYGSSATVDDTYPADIHIVAEVATRPTHSSANAMVVGARLTGADTSSHAGYMGAAFTGSSQDNWRIYRVTGGSATLLVSGNAAQLVAGDAIGLVLSGTTIELWHRVGGVWSLRQSTTDGTHTAGGAIGLEAKGNVATPGAFDAIYTSYSSGPADTTITAPFLASATQGYAPTLTNAPAQDITAPFLPSGEQTFAPTLENAAAQDLAAPFLPAATVLYPPTLTNADGPPDTTITAPFLPSAEQAFAPSLSNAAAQTLTAPFLAAQTQLYPPTLTNAGTPETTIVAPFLPAATQLWAPTLSTTRSPAAPHAHPRPVEESIILRSEGGQWMVVGQGAARGIVHEGLSLSADRGGPSTCSFTLKRDPGVSWPDLSPYNEVLVEIGGVRVWSGRMREAPGQSGATNTISFTGSGWQSHLDDDLLAKGWVHTRLSEWQDSRGFTRLLDGSSSWSQQWQIGTDGGIPSIAIPAGSRFTTGDRGALVLDLGAHTRAVAMRLRLSASNPNANLRARLRGIPDGATFATGSENNSWWVGHGAIADTASGAMTTLGTVGVGSGAQPWRYVALILEIPDLASGNTGGGDHVLRIHEATVASDAAHISGGLLASRVIRDVVDSGSLPRLSRDKSRIFTTGLPIPDYWPQGFHSPRELMEPVNAFHDWHLGVDVDRRVFFEPPSDLPTVEIGEWSGAEFTDASAGSGEDVYSKVIVQASDPAGQPLEVIRTAATAVPELAVMVPLDGAIYNPSFETDTVGWSLTDLVRSNVTAGHGSWSLRYDASTATPTGIAIATLTGLSPGVPHMARWWTSGVGSGGAGSSVQRITVTGPSGQEGALTYHGGIGWQSLVWVPRGETATFRFECDALAIPGGGGYVYLDDVRINRIEVNAVDRHRFARAQRLPIGAPLSQAAAEVIGDIWLRNHIRTPLKGSVTVTGQGGVREVIGGAPVHPAHLLLRAGECIRHAGMADPDTGAWGRVGRIASVSYTGGQATIEIDNERHAFDALISRYAALAGQVG